MCDKKDLFGKNFLKLRADSYSFAAYVYSKHIYRLVFLL